MPDAGVLCSLIIPVYRNQENLDRLLAELAKLAARPDRRLEVVFVVDGSPDSSREILEQRLPQCSFPSKLICLSRNFGSFPAIRAGLEAASGRFFATLAADMQEPPELAVRFFEALENDQADIVFGYRSSRSDPWADELLASGFWWIYRAFVVPDLPRGGVDAFGCSQPVRDALLRFPESNTNLIALLFWLGYRRQYVGYDRLPRREGVSAWTFAKKLQYCFDSIFNFTDLPIRVLLLSGLAGLLFTSVFSITVLISRFAGKIPVPGYAPIVLTLGFLGSVGLLGMGIIGQYLWLCLQNVRRRPNYVVESFSEFHPPQQV